MMMVSRVLLQWCCRTHHHGGTMPYGMKYESADPANVQRYITDAAWSLEQKVDGIRIIIRTDDSGRATFYSHTGEPLKSGTRHFPTIARAVACLRSCTLDGELLESGDVWLFDCMEVLGADTRLLAQAERRRLLDLMADAFAGSVVHIVPQATTTDAKLALWSLVLASGAEGVVAKRTTARYETGSKHTRTSDVLKIKIVRSVDVVIMARNSDGHYNATLGMYDNGRLTQIGKCSMNGKPNAAVGDVIEVTFLYVVDPTNPALCQPRMMRTRPDKAAADCTIDQLDGCTASRAVLTS